MSPAVVNHHYYRGTTFEAWLQGLQRDGSPFPMRDFQAVAQVRRPNGQLVASLVPEVLQDDSGLIRLSIDHITGASLPLGTFDWSCVISRDGSSWFPQWTGFFRILASPTSIPL